MNFKSVFMIWTVLITLALPAGDLWGQQNSTGIKRGQAKKRVLILGDSISMGYTKHVQNALKDQATVLRPMNKSGRGAENCAGTKKGIGAIDRWLKIDGGKWDVIHFNFGLHDLKHVNKETGRNSNKADDPHQSDPKAYEKQLSEIVKKLKATGAVLIFATTTPVPEGGVRPYRDPKDVVKYNDIAKKIMKENNIAVNDLYAFAKPRLSKIQNKVDVHFSKEGSKALGDQVVAAIKKAMKSKAE